MKIGAYVKIDGAVKSHFGSTKIIP